MVEENYSFKDWFFSKKQIIEKSIGLVLGFVGLINQFAILFGKREGNDLIISYLNAGCLIYILIIINNYFSTKFYVKKFDTPEIKGTLNLSFNGNEDNKEIVRNLTMNANVFVNKLRSFKLFILATLAIYFVLIFHTNLLENWHFGGAACSKTVSNVRELLCDWRIKNTTVHLLNFFTYIGDYYLIRCYYVFNSTHLNEIEDNTLNKETNPYLLIIGILMFFDYYVGSHFNELGIFISQLICGVINGLVFMLFVSRFENRVFGIPHVVIAFLYLYALMQVLMPFLNLDITHVVYFSKEVHSQLTTIILEICLFGKIVMAAVMLYVVKSGRLFYYFLTINNVREIEETKWLSFQPNLQYSSDSFEEIQLNYISKEDSTYIVSMPELTIVTGTGQSREEAKADFINKLKQIKQ